VDSTEQHHQKLAQATRRISVANGYVKLVDSTEPYHQKLAQATRWVCVVEEIPLPLLTSRGSSVASGVASKDIVKV